MVQQSSRMYPKRDGINGHLKAYSRGPSPMGIPHGVQSPSDRIVMQNVSYCINPIDRSDHQSISSSHIHLSLGRSPRSPSFPMASKTGVPDTPSILAF